jgi:hypothetical protein
VAAYAQYMQAQFDAEQPPACSALFTAKRRALQRLGRLPPGEGQLHPRFLQVFMDDFTGAALTDVVLVPPSVMHIEVVDQHMRAAGCTPAPVNSRVHVHARLTILALTHAGLYAAPHKVAIGSPLPALGLLVDGGRRLIVCPAGKRHAMLTDIAKQTAVARADGTVDRKRAVRLVGRLSHLTQVAPAIRSSLHGGHTIAEARWPGSGGGRGVGTMRLSPDSTAYAGWLHLLHSASVHLTANQGVAIAPRRTAPARDVPGTVTAFTDASGEDGFGGYAFVAGRDREVFVLSQPWPRAALVALTASSSVAEAELRRQNSPHAQPSLAMPSAELFAQVILPVALSRLAACACVYAVGDCQPSSGVVAALHSGNAQMRLLVQEGARQPWTWVSAHVQREANRDADRLSHPSLLGAVRADAEAAGLTVTELQLIQSDWELLDRAIAASAPSLAGGRKRRR